MWWPQRLSICQVSGLSTFLLKLIWPFSRPPVPELCADYAGLRTMATILTSLLSLSKSMLLTFAPLSAVSSLRLLQPLAAF